MVCSGWMRQFHTDTILLSDMYCMIDIVQWKQILYGVLLANIIRNKSKS